MEIAIGFFRINWWVMRWIEFFSGSKGVDHCSLIYRVPNKPAYILHINKRVTARFVRLKALLKVYQPIGTVNLGACNLTEDQVRSFVDKPTKFQLWKTVLWFFVTRWFIDWKPYGGCAYITSKILQEAGMDVNTCVKPIDLLKELEDGDYIISRTGWSG